MKRIFSLMLLCAAVIFSGCGKDDPDPDPDPIPIPVTGVTLDKTSLSLEIGKTATLVATIAPKDAEVTAVVWSSDKPAVATVDDKGVVTAVAEGTATITVKTENGGKTATCVVTVEELDFIEVNGIKVAIGNLVADGANGAKIGAATDSSLYFQFGSLIGWSATSKRPTVSVSPVGYTVTSWNSSWTGDPTTDDAVSGTGDPCRYYLKGTWHLPTKDEYLALLKDDGYPSGTWKWENSSATHSTTNLTFPALYYRDAFDGSLNVFKVGFYWSASLRAGSADGYYFYFDSSIWNPSESSPQADGFPVRCVK